MASEQTRGRLKVFLGYASGVGKSFRMFDEGRRRRERGQDVVVGARQPVVPPELKALVESIETVPTIDTGGVPVMDVEGILKRNPQVCLVDGLAYDNPVLSRNAHRWQDVEELLAAGIQVVGSVNLQYIDDQSEAVAKITGKRVTQTIPRSFLNTADEIVIVVAPSNRDAESISTLREMALLLSADVVDRGLQHYLREHGIEPLCGVHERFLICLTPRANFARMHESARRSAAGFHCDVLAAYVKQRELSAEDATKLQEVLEEARSAGLLVVELEGEDPIETITQYARSHGVTQIFAGHSLQSGWKARLFGSPVNRLVRAAQGMDVRIFPH